MKKEGSNKDEVVFDRDLSPNMGKFKVKKRQKVNTEEAKEVVNEGKKNGDVDEGQKGEEMTLMDIQGDNVNKEGGNGEANQEGMVNTQIQLGETQRTIKNETQLDENNDEVNDNNNNNSNINIDNGNENEENQPLTVITKQNENENNNDSNININNNNDNEITPITPIENLPKSPPYHEPIIINPDTPFPGQTISQKLNLNLKPKPKHTITFIYRRKSYTVTLPTTSTISSLRSAISSLIHIFPEDISITLNNISYNDNQSNTILITSLLKQSPSLPIFEIKKKTLFTSKSNTSLLFPKTYPNKVIINNSPSSSELKKEIEQFFKDCLIEMDYKIETMSSKKYAVGFMVPDTAFDFNRYLLILKSRNDKFKEIKTGMYFSKRVKERSLSNGMGLGMEKEDKYKSALYVGLSGPYVSKEERMRKEYIDNKKKWVSKKGFIPYAKKKNSEMCNKYLY